MEDNNDTVDWEKAIISLHAYTFSIVKAKGWFRGNFTEIFPEGKEVSDYVYEAIGRYLKHPEKFDASKGTLINYLKFNIIRSLVSNDLTSAENRCSTDTPLIADSDDEENYQQLIEPLLNVFFDEEIDYQTIMQKVHCAIEDNEILQKIFNGISEENLKRREIMEHYQISEKDFDNGIRRLKTILKKVAKEFNLKN